MNEDKSILIVKDYGRVNLKLRDIIDERGITRNALANLADTRFEVIDKWYNNKVERLDLDILARICYVLDCEPSDIIDYTHE